MHLVQTMAYVGTEPWHGLGNRLARNSRSKLGTSRRDELAHRRSRSALRCFWQPQSRLDSRVSRTKVLYRSDTKVPLSVVSSRYQVVQPEEILEFYRDLTEIGGFQLETAGVLKEGRALALARTGQSGSLKGKDQVNGYLLLATACDGTLATTAQFTSVRVVCNNTLAVGRTAPARSVSHRSQFDAAAVKRQLGIAVSTWDAFMTRTKALSERKVTDSAAEAFLRRVLIYSTANLPDRETVAVNEGAIKAIEPTLCRTWERRRPGFSIRYSLGLLNAVTEYVDHHRRARSDDHRIDAAWFGAGATLKERAWDEAMKLVA
jgi:phage/plasmid-like protein (TIGR03299 family)